MTDPKGEAAMWRVHWDAARRLVLVRGEAQVLVQVICCFPWSYPDCYISLRNEDGDEEAFVARLSELDADQRSILEQALRLRNFIPEIISIEAIADDQELYVWSVTTQAGPRRFLTERRNHIRPLHGGKVLVRDVAGDMLMLRDPTALDAKSYALIRLQLE